MPYNTKFINEKKRIYGFATAPEVVMYSVSEKKKPVQHLIFGDYINLLPNKNQTEIQQHDGWIFVRGRGENGWIRGSQVQKERVLEVNFVDIGQGDGCHIVTPDDKQIIIDAGEEDNMYRFLSWRYNLRKHSNRMKDLTAIITHPDLDHYKGFQYLFEEGQLSFSKIYHNGIVERANDPVSSIGGHTLIGNSKFLADIIEDDNSLKTILNDDTKRGRKRYLNTLHKAISNISNKNVSFEMLHHKRKYVPGYEVDKPVSMEILGPVGETDKNGKLCLKYFSNIGETKNGHSVSIMLRIGKLKIFLGGDLNIKSENYLLKHYTNLNPESLKKKIKREDDPVKKEKLKMDLEDVVTKGRKVFESHIAKSCHHGSHHFTTEFLRSINSIATVISSGDNESHGHPRPDALGAFGKYGRGERPLIFSTELARSHKEVIKRPFQLRKRIRYFVSAIDKENDPVKKKKLQKKLDISLAKIERTVAVYGMINVRTDGEKVIICQKLERPRTAGQKWDIHELVYNEDIKDFEYKIKLKH